MTVYFTSDTHFWHRNIIKYCNRPFAPKELIENDSYDDSHVRDMNKEMERRWNETVKPRDVIYHLGDFAFPKSMDDTARLLKRLNGYKVLISGNHDPGKIRRLPHWNEVHKSLTIELDEHTIFMSHYPYDDWDGKENGVIHLHGHTHGNLNRTEQTIPNRFDVGVDVYDFYPVTLQTILEKGFIKI